MRTRALTLLLALFAIGPFAAAQGKVFMTTDEALKLAFPKCKVTRVQHVLDKQKHANVLKLAGTRSRRSMVIAYEARKDGKLVGTAYFDRHRVRSQNEVLMVVVSPVCRIARIEIIQFGEPTDYLPRGNFYAQLIGRELDKDLSTRRSVTNVAGCTLTVNATVECVRRLLAVHRIFYPKQVAKKKAPKPKKPVVTAKK